MTDLHQALSRTALLVQRDLFPQLASEVIVEHLAARRIRLRSDEWNLETPAGQAAAVAATIALAQTGARLSIDLPNVELHGRQPPLREKAPLADGLRRLCADLMQPADLEPDEPVDLSVVLGDSPADDADRALRLCGSAWEAIVTPGRSTSATRWRGDVPFGPLLAAAAGAAEAFRGTMAALAASGDVTPLPEHHVGPPCPSRLAVEAVDLRHGVDLGAVDVVSAGAITNGALAALLRVPGVRGALRIIDGDVGTVDNLNRYELLCARTLGRPKVRVLGDFGTTALPIEPIPVRLEHESGPMRLSSRVLVGVDHIPSRWLAQQRAPGWLCVAGTSRMEIVVSEHTPGGPCAGCMHPYDDNSEALIPTVSFVSQLAGVLQAHRLVHHASRETTLPAVVAYGLGLHGARPLLPIGQPPRGDCPVGCEASRPLAA